MIKQLYAAMQELNSTSGSALVSKKAWQPLNCLSCGRGDAHYAPMAPNVKGRDGKYYKGDFSLTKPQSQPVEFDRFETGQEVFSIDTHEQHHHFVDGVYRGSMDSSTKHAMKQAPLNVVLGMDVQGTNSRASSKMNLSPVKSGARRPKSAKK